MGGGDIPYPARTATRALVVGAGETSVLIHLPALARLRDQGRLELTEICDLRIERAAAARERFGFARHGGDALSAVRAADIDAVYLFGDARMHHEIGMAALEAGKHLFVEKPVAPGYGEACEMAQAARRRGLIAAGGHNRRFAPSLREVRKRGGKAGWRYAEAVFHKPAFGAPAPFAASSWLTANGIHALDALIFIMGGLPEQVASFAGQERYSALMRWADRAQGVFLCDNGAGERRESYAFHAPGETCRVDDGGLHISTGGTVDIAFPPLTDGFHEEHAAFLDAVEHGGEPVNSLAALAPALKLAELIEAGFSGALAKPAQSGAAAPARRPADGAVVVINPTGLLSALAGVSPRRPLVAFEEVARSPGPRPEVVAALIGAGPSVLTSEILDKLPNLQVAGVVGLSFARHRPDLLLERDVALVNASAAYAESVAEFAFGLAVLARRRAFVSDRIMQRGGWGTVRRAEGWKGAALQAARSLRPALARAGLEQALLETWRKTKPLHGIDTGNATPPRDLAGATVGLIGWGANAQAFARRLSAAGAEVLVFSEHAAPEDLRRAGVTPVGLGEALACEIVSLHRGLTPQTHHYLGAAELARLRPGAILINVARARLIDPDALLVRVKKGDVFACLDVFEDEPPARHHPLRNLPNVFLTSHIAGGSKDTPAGAMREVIDKIERHLAGEPALAVRRERLRTMT